jgi:hypothetical protein
MINIFLPNNLNFLILEKKKIKNIYIYNKSNFILININNFKISFNKYLNIIKLNKINEIKIKNNINNTLNKFLFSWDYFLFKKIIFLGKSFKLKKKKQNLYFFFNHSHTMLLVTLNNYLKKIQKNKIIIFYKNYNNLNNFLKKITLIKPNSIYTKRGLRFARQIILKRKGKSN